MTKKRNQTVTQSVALRDAVACSQENKSAFLNKAKALGLKLWRDESGQGTAEYVLILVGVLAVAMIFKNQLVEAVKSKMGTVGGAIGKFTGEGGG